ncbi:signal peptidase II [Actinomarinicola tropica]|uniref:signal peptidase II n=1 Tax=Actinomarinicola tropica TaxID=2789776 RepID=UPI00189A8E3D|nr:signal peptidase II [Actinomarinicola tropica]
MNRAAAGSARWIRALGIAAVVVALDQATKHWALGALSDDRTIDLVGSLRFNLAFNTGASFSMGSGMGPVFAVIVVVVVIALLRFIRTVPGRLNLFAAGIIVGGALGNLVDRIFRDGSGFLGGAVVDFIDLQWWPIFNVADIGVVGGALLLLVGTWRLGESSPREADADSSSGPEAV